MNEFVSPGHHILVVDARGGVLARSRHHSSVEVERALLGADPRQRVIEMPDHRLAQFRHRLDDGTTIILAQFLDHVEHILRGQLISRATMAAAMAAALIALIFLVIHVWVLGPFSRLTEAGKAWAGRDFSNRAEPAGSADVRRLIEEFNAMAARLEAYELDRTVALEHARQIQMNLLPRGLPEVSSLAFATAYHAAEHVAGDLYDVFTLPNGRTAIAILDVAGHGISAALLTGAVKMSLHRRLEECNAPAAALAAVNRDLLEWVPQDRFVTVCVGVWDPSDHVWTYASAGHPGGLVLSGGRIEVLESTGPPVGLVSDADWEVRSLPLGDGDRLLLYTDGVTDAGYPGETLGEDGVRRILQTVADAGLHEQIAALEDQILARSGGVLSDDVTLVAFESRSA